MSSAWKCTCYVDTCHPTVASRVVFWALWLFPENLIASLMLGKENCQITGKLMLFISMVHGKSGREPRMRPGGRSAERGEA